MGTEHAKMKLKGKILVVDDEPSIRKYLQSVLEVDGYHVESVSNGKDAISKVENGERPGLIILDLVMPEMNGLDALEELMRLDPSLNIIMISCSTHFGTITEAIRLGARDYLTIPFEKVELEEAMRGVKQGKQDRLRTNCWVERRVSRLPMKKQVQFWATSNL
jgi:DNA-binding NtrC family response regulator